MDSDLSSKSEKKKKKKRKRGKRKKRGKKISKEQFENMRGGKDEMHAPSVETTTPAICGEANVNTEGLFFFKCGALRGALIILSFVLARFFIDVLNGGQFFSFAMRFKEEPSNGSVSPYRVGFSSGELLKTSEGLSKCSADNLKPVVAVGDWKMCLKDEDDADRTLLLGGFVLDGFETAEGLGVFDGIVFDSEPTSDAKGKRRLASQDVGIVASTTADSWCASLLDTNGADIVNQSSYSLYQGGSACDLWTVEFSGQREGCFDLNDQDISLVKKGHSYGSVIVDPWFPRELILQYWVSSSLGVLPSSLEVPSLHAFDTLEPETAASASRLICFFKYEKEALESLLLDCFETAEGGDEDEGSAAGFRATKCDGCLGDSGPIFDDTSLSGKNRAENSEYGNRRSYRRCQINGTSLSEEEKETLTCGLLLPSSEVPSLYIFDFLEPEVAIGDSTMNCSEYKKKSLLLNGFKTAEAPQKDKGTILGFRSKKSDAKVKLQSSAHDGSLALCAVVLCVDSLSETIGADIKRALCGDARSNRRRRVGSTELSGEIEHHFDVDVHCRNISSGYSRGTFFIEKSSMDRCFESSTNLFPCLASCSLGEVPPLCSLDILKPEVNHSRMVWSEHEIGAMDSEFFLDDFETSKGPEKGEGSAARVRATKCDAEVQLQAGGNDGCLEDSGPIVDQCTPPRVPTVLGNVRALFSSFRRRLLGRESPSYSSSLNRRNYRDGCPGDPAKAIGSELAGAGLQAQEEKVRDFILFLIFTMQSKERSSSK
jgi:hypothetical protein